MTSPLTVVAVVTAYDPGPALADLVADTMPQVAAVVVIDDGSRSGLDVVDVAAALGATVVRQDNAGVAAALNTGFRAAVECGADLVLTLDQDSRLPGGYVDHAVAAWERGRDRGVPVALVAAASYSGHPTPTMGLVAGLDVAFDPMQSGTLVPVTSWAAVGGYDDALVIDGVDSDFTVRCRELGLVPLVGAGCDLVHGQGERTPGEVFGVAVPLLVNRHPPQRVYTMARNGTRITRAHLRTQPRWVVRRAAQEVTAHALRLALSPGRGAQVRALVRGVRDGLRSG